MAPFNEILIAGAVGLLLLLILSVTWSHARSFRCLVTGRKVTATFRQVILNGRLLDVERCSAFNPETAVTCTKTCLLTEANPESRKRQAYES